MFAPAAPRSSWAVALAGGLVGAAIATAVVLTLDRGGDGSTRFAAEPSDLTLASTVAPPLATAAGVPATTAPVSTMPATSTTVAPTTTVATTTTSVPAPATTMATVRTTLPPPSTDAVGALFVRAAGAAESVGAVPVSASMLVTAAEAVNGVQQLEVLVGDQVLAARVLAVEPSTGVVLLAVEGTPLTPAPVGSAVSLASGTTVRAISGAGGSNATVSKLGCTGVAGDGTTLSAMVGLQQEVPAGTVLAHRDQVVGLVVAPDDDTDGSLAVPIDVALALGRSYADSGSFQRAWFGLSVGTGPNGTSTVVTDVQTGSPAAVAGVQVGDHVIGVDGRVLHEPRPVINLCRC
jgi:S1-C subfamily serine protease